MTFDTVGMVISLLQDKDYNNAATFKYAHSNIYISNDKFDHTLYIMQTSIQTL